MEINPDEKTYDLGGDIFLKELRVEDINNSYLGWFKDEQVTEFLDAKNISKEDAVNHLLKGIETKSYYMYAIIAKDSWLHIGNVKIGPINWQHLVADLPVIIGLPSYWGKGLASEAIKIGNHISFNVFGLRKLSGAIASGNVGSIKAYTKGNWIIEGKLKDHLLINGVAQDKVMVSCFNPVFFNNL